MITSYTKGTLIKSQKQDPFNDEEGNQVIYCKNWLEIDDEIVTLNSKEEYSQAKGAEGVIKLNIRPEGKLYRISLGGFKVDETDSLDDIEF